MARAMASHLRKLRDFASGDDEHASDRRKQLNHGFTNVASKSRSLHPWVQSRDPDKRHHDLVTFSINE
jgi:hypothetical protein